MALNFLPLAEHRNGWIESGAVKILSDSGLLAGPHPMIRRSHRGMAMEPWVCGTWDTQKLRELRFVTAPGSRPPRRWGYGQLDFWDNRSKHRAFTENQGARPYTRLQARCPPRWDREFAFSHGSFLISRRFGLSLHDDSRATHGVLSIIGDDAIPLQAISASHNKIDGAVSSLCPRALTWGAAFHAFESLTDTRNIVHAITLAAEPAIFWAL